MKRGSGLIYSLLLLTAAFIWGMAFVSQSKGMDYMGPLTFNGVRSLIGAFVLALYLLLTGRVTGEKRRSTDWKMTFRGGLCCGLALTAASTLQQFGIQYTTVGKAGFITTLYIIFVPIAGIFFRRRVSGIVWAGAVMAAAGMYLLCMTESLSLGRGDLLVFFCAVVFTAHILLVDFFLPGWIVLRFPAFSLQSAESCAPEGRFFGSSLPGDSCGTARERWLMRGC